jgi:hypothetical protein
MRTGVFAVFVFVGVSVCTAQGNREIVTDRPDVTESRIVVPVGTLQLENSLTWTQDHGSVNLDGSESLLRLGIWNRTEFRLVVPNYLGTIDGRLRPSGLTDVALGMKEQLGPLPGSIDLSVIVAVSIPTGTRSVTSQGFDPFIKFPWSRDLKSGWSVGGMQSLFYETDDRRRNLTSEPTFYVEREITKRSDAFTEYAGDYPHFGGARQIIHFGTAYRVTPHQQVDFHFGFGLSHAAPNHFFAVGYSFRIDELFGGSRK